MDLVIPYWHPAVVHFPVALLTVGAVAVLVYAVTGTPFWRGVALLLFVVGALGAWGAVWTGETIYEGVEGTPVVEVFVEQHETYGEWTLWLSVATALGLAATSGWVWRTGRPADRRDPLAVRLILCAFGLAAGVLVVLAGRLGGLMVWGVSA